MYVLVCSSVCSAIQERLMRKLSMSTVKQVVVYLNVHPLTVAPLFIFLPVSAASSALFNWPIPIPPFFVSFRLAPSLPHLTGVILREPRSMILGQG